MSDEELPSVVSRSADSIKIKVPHWLWDRRIPVGAVTLLAGREGLGKSSIALMLAGKLTRGNLDGRLNGVAKGVGIVATEDDWATTIAPRLVATGADLSRVHQIEAVNKTDRHIETVTLPDHIDGLGEVCLRQDIGLIIIDPVMSVLPSNIDTHKDREVRRALDPLVRFSAKSGVSVIGLIHVNKSNGVDPLNAIMGSRAFAAVSRSVLYCSVDPDNETEFLLGHVKSNLGPKQPTLAYRLVEVKVEIPDPDDPEDSIAVVSRAVLGDVDTRTMREVMEEQQAGRPQGANATAIEEFVNGYGGAVTTRQITDAFAEIKAETVKVILGRLVKKGKIDRPSQGLYQAVTHRVGNGESNTSSGVLLPSTPVTSVTPGLIKVSSTTDRSVTGEVTRVTEVLGNSARDTCYPDSETAAWIDEWPDIPPPDEE